MSSDIFPNVLSFFAVATKGYAPGGEENETATRRGYCHDTTRVFPVAKCYTHYNYCHLVVCCVLKAVGKNELVSLTGGGA